MLLTQNKKRNQDYLAFLERCHKQQASAQDLIDLGEDWMRKEKIFHHFFEDHSLRAVAQELLCFSLKISPEAWPEHLERRITPPEAREILALFEKRIAERTPLAYLTQEAKYLERRFYVNEQVLVPRSLMNTRFEEFLARVPWENHRVLDLCTGSGCIGLSLALLDPRLRVDLADISAGALQVAAINVQRFALGARVTCIQSDLFREINGKYDLIISNPPYVRDDEYARQPPEIKKEPALALKGGRDGMDLVNRILVEAKAYLNPRGLLVMEVGYGVAQRLKWRYPKVRLEGVCYKKPSANQKPWFLEKILRWLDYPFEWSGLMDGVVICEGVELPREISWKNYPVKSLIFRVYWFWKEVWKQRRTK